MEENKRRVQDELLTNVQAIPGFVDFYLIYTDKETEVSVALFKDAKGLQLYTEMASRFTKQFAENVSLTSYTEGQVVVQSRTPVTVA